MRRLSRLLLPASLLGSTLLMGSAAVSYYEESLPSTMNPLFARSMVDFRSHELVFDRLFFRSAITNELRSRIVTKFERVDGGKAIKLWLREGVVWHDEKPLTPADVCFTVGVLLDPKVPSPVAKPFREALAGCDEVPKDNAVVVRLRKVFHEPRERLGFAVLPKHAFEGAAMQPDLPFSSRPIGTGPMKGSQGRQGVKFTAGRNVHRTPRIGEINLQEGGDPFVQVKTLVNGGVHGVLSVAPPLRPEVAASDEVALKSYDLRSWWFIAVNTHRGPLKSQAIRRAIGHTIDRTELRELTIGVEKNDPNPPCEFVSGPFVQSSPYYNRQVPVFERSDRARARQLMTEAGATLQAGRWVFQGQPVNLKIGMHAPLDTEAKDLLNQIGNQLQAGGFDRQVYKVTADTWNRKAVTGQLDDYDLLVGKWSFGLVEDINALFHTRKDGRGALNIFNYSHPEVDRLLARYENAKTDTEARDAYHEVHAFLAEDAPYLFLWKLDTKSAWRNEIRNNTIAPYYYFTEFDGWSFEG